MKKTGLLVFVGYIISFMFIFGIKALAESSPPNIIADNITADSFINSTDISITKDNLSSNSNIAGVYSNNKLTLFNNTTSGTISVSATAGDNKDNSTVENLSIFGGWLNNGAAAFTNSGNIDVSAKIGDVNGDGGTIYNRYICGMHTVGNVEEFSNSGSINISTIAGDATGTRSRVFNLFVPGIALKNSIYKSFSNSGSINISAYIGNVRNISSGFNSFILGTHLDNVSIESFSNSGNININTSVEKIDNRSRAGNSDIFGTQFYKSHVGSFINSGNINIVSNIKYITGGSFGRNSDISGVYFKKCEDNTSFINTGNINILTRIDNVLNPNSSGLNYRVYGAYFDNISSFSNSGNINVMSKISNISSETEAETHATSGINGNIYGVSFNQHTGSFLNSGNINVIATSWDTSNNDPISANFQIEGVLFNSLDSFSNSGNINVLSIVGNISGDNATTYNEDICGVLLSSFSKDNTTFTNSGNINVSSIIGDLTGKNAHANNDSVDGVFLFLGSNNSFINSGSINVLANISNISGENPEIENSRIAGVEIDGDKNSIFTNSGTINVISTTEKNTVDNLSAMHSDIYGVSFYSDNNSSFNNSGTINLTINADNKATIQNIATVYALMGEDNSSIYNSGTISLNVNSSSDNVTETTVLYIGKVSNVTLNSPGKIVAKGNSKIRDLYIYKATVTLENALGLGFSGDPNEKVRPIYIAEGGTLNLNNAKLIAYADKDIAIGKPYYIIEISDASNSSDATLTSQVKGTFGSLELISQNPDITASWYENNKGADSAVIFGYNPKSSTSAMGTSSAYTSTMSSLNTLSSFIFNRSVLANQMANLFDSNNSVMFASSNAIETDISYNTGTSTRYKNGFFILPYYTKTNANDLGYNSSTTGMEFGYERKINDAFKVGIFAGYGTSNVDYTGNYSTDSEDQDLYNAGLYGVFNKNNYYAALIASYNYVKQKYAGKTGPNLDINESDSYYSNTYQVKAVGGYNFKLQNSMNIMPLVGISYTSWHTPSHTTTTDDSIWDKHYDSYNKDFVIGIAKLNVNKGWVAKNTRIIAYAGLGIEQALNSNDIVINQSIPGINSPVKSVKESIGNTTGTGQVGLNIIQGNINLNLTLNSKLNSDYKIYSAYANFGWKF